MLSSTLQKSVSDVPINSSQQDLGANLERGLTSSEDVCQADIQPWTLNENNLSTGKVSECLAQLVCMIMITSILS